MRFNGNRSPPVRPNSKVLGQLCVAWKDEEYGLSFVWEVMGIAGGYEMNLLRIPVCCRRHLAHLYRFRTLQKQAASDIRAVPVISACHVSAGPEPAMMSYAVLC